MTPEMQALAMDLAAIDRECCLAGLSSLSPATSACQHVVLSGAELDASDDQTLMYLHAQVVEALMAADRCAGQRDTLAALEVWCLTQLEILQ